LGGERSGGLAEKPLKAFKKWQMSCLIQFGTSGWF
jgi:hypothetical protein